MVICYNSNRELIQNKWKIDSKMADVNPTISDSIKYELMKHAN